MSNKKRKIIGIIYVSAVLFISLMLMLIFNQYIGVTIYSLAGILFLAFHLIYGILACAFKCKGNFLQFKHRFARGFFKGFIFHFFFFYLFEEDKDYILTEEYEQQFSWMAIVYFGVVPLYIPCIFLSQSLAYMIIPVAVFALPQIVFLVVKPPRLFEPFEYAKQMKAQAELEEREKKEQERRESMGEWK